MYQAREPSSLIRIALFTAPRDRVLIASSLDPDGASNRSGQAWLAIESALFRRRVSPRERLVSMLRKDTAWVPASWISLRFVDSPDVWVLQLSSCFRPAAAGHPWWATVAAHARFWFRSRRREISTWSIWALEGDESGITFVSCELEPTVSSTKLRRARKRHMLMALVLSVPRLWLFISLLVTEMQGRQGGEGRITSHLALKRT